MNRNFFTEREERTTGTAVLEPQTFEALALAPAVSPEPQNRRKFEKVVQGRSYADEDIVLPVRATRASAGYDFVLPHDITIPAEGTLRFPTDIKARMEADDVLLLFLRSSIAGKGLEIPSGVAVIDADYYNNPDNEGNIQAILHNTTGAEICLPKGHRFMQGIFTKYLVTCDDQATGTRRGGMGSTTKRCN